MNSTSLTEWYIKALTYTRPHLTSENIQRLAIAATEHALQYAKDHPYSATFSVLSIGLAPILGANWITMSLLRVIGFGPLGPYAGSIAAWYQSTYLGAHIPAGSIFAGLQRLAMAKL